MAGRQTQQQVLQRIENASRRALFAQEEADLRAILKLYDEAENELASQLYLMHESLEEAVGEGDEKRVDYLKWKILREEQFADQVRSRLDRLRVEMTAKLSASLRAQAKTQARYSAYAIDMATPPSIRVDTRALTDDSVDAIVNTPWEGAMFSHRTLALTDDLAREMQNIVGSGVLLGKGTDEIVRDIRNAGVGSTNTGPRYVIERIVRTEVLKAADRARHRVYADNSDVVTGEIVVATIDSRTDDDCAALDGLEIDSAQARAIIESADFADRPPFHPNCRCVTAPALKPWKDLLGLGEAPDDLEEIGAEDRVIRDPSTGRTVLVAFEPFEKWVAERGQ
jgi:SPP1 gp7 family putative phage head morphogenesis protein